MTKKVKTVIISSVALALILTLSALGYWAWKYYFLPNVEDTKGKTGIFIPAMPDRAEYESLKARAAVAHGFAKERNMSTRYALFVDYGVPSGTPRLYVWDFMQNKIVARTYVMHGPGMGSTAKKPVFSNKPGSNCSSLGRFLITKEHGKTNKTGFRLRGLDTDNQTAYRRGLLIHKSIYLDSHAWMNYIPLNGRSCLGCITVTSRGMDYIGKLVQNESRPILLWNYCSK